MRGAGEPERLDSACWGHSSLLKEVDLFVQLGTPLGTKAVFSGVRRTVECVLVLLYVC